MLTVKSAREPRWNSAEHTSLNVLVTFEETADTLGEIPFTATPDDCEVHGRELFDRAVGLEFGPVHEPAAEVLEQATLLTRSRLVNTATSTINRLQVAFETLQDAVQLDLATDAAKALLPLRQAELNAWRTYRVLLSQIEAQLGFPTVINWPAKPSEA